MVHSQAVGDGRASLKYLAHDVLRVAISDRRVVSCEDDRVTFSCLKSGSNRWRTMTVDALEFIRRFLPHVLPSGLPKVRHYGFLSANSRESIEVVRWLAALFYGLAYWLSPQLGATPTDAIPIRCAACGAPMRVLAFLPCQAAPFDTS